MNAPDWSPMPKVVGRRLVAMASVASLEICGVLDEEWGIHPLTNIHKQPGSNFEVDSDELIDLMIGLEGRFLGVYHSHPGGAHHPSDNDCIQWAYPNNRYWIIAAGDVYEWEIKDGAAKAITPFGKRGASGLAYPLLASAETVRR